jgi:hypothetical protein
VIAPTVLPRVKERFPFACGRIYSIDADELPVVAALTGQRQV